VVQSPVGDEWLWWVLQLQRGHTEVRHEETSKEERSGVVLTEESSGGDVILIQIGDERCTPVTGEGQLAPGRDEGGVEVLLSDRFHTWRVGNGGFLVLLRRERRRGIGGGIRPRQPKWEG
jgi:hypothetical protein